MRFNLGGLKSPTYMCDGGKTLVDKDSLPLHQSLKFHLVARGKKEQNISSLDG